MANAASVAQGVLSSAFSFCSPGPDFGTGGLTKLTRAASAAFCLAICFDGPYPLYWAPSTVTETPNC